MVFASFFFPPSRVCMWFAHNREQTSVPEGDEHLRLKHRSQQCGSSGGLDLSDSQTLSVFSFAILFIFACAWSSAALAKSVTPNSTDELVDLSSFVCLFVHDTAAVHAHLPWQHIYFPVETLFSFCLIYWGPDYTLFTGTRKHNDNLAAYKHLKHCYYFSIQWEHTRQSSLLDPGYLSRPQPHQCVICRTDMEKKSNTKKKERVFFFNLGSGSVFVWPCFRAHVLFNSMRANYSIFFNWCRRCQSKRRRH